MRSTRIAKYRYIAAGTSRLSPQYADNLVLGPADIERLANSRNDDAVAGAWDIAGPEPVWKWEPLYDQTDKSEDMSFVLFTEPDCMKKTHLDYATSASLDRPDCWCYARQCRGDINGLQQGPFWVSLTDLTILRLYINKMDIPATTVVPCCDQNGDCVLTPAESFNFWTSP